MHDPDFDGDFPKKAVATALGSIRSKVPARIDLSRWLPHRPIPRFAQAVFAESLRQGIVEGVPIDHAIRLAAEVNPSRRFVPALLDMAKNVRAGYPLDEALEKTRVKVQPGLLAALSVGEEHGCLAEELSIFAKPTRGFSSKRYYRAIGRSEEAIAFAAAMGRLLRVQTLTVRTVRAAGEISAAGRPSFAAVVKGVAQAMEDGSPLIHALAAYPAHFDRLYLGLLDAARSREETKGCFDRLGSST